MKSEIGKWFGFLFLARMIPNIACIWSFETTGFPHVQDIGDVRGISMDVCSHEESSNDLSITIEGCR